MLSRFLIDLGWIWNRFGVDLGSIWGRFSVLGGSWECRARLWGRHWRPRLIFNEFQDDFEARLGAQNKPKSITNQCQDAFKFCIGFRIDFESIFVRFWGPFGYHFGVMLGIVWGIGDIAKNIENAVFFYDFSRFGGSKLASFSYIFGVLVSRSVFDRLGVGFGVDFGTVWALKWGLC